MVYRNYLLIAVLALALAGACEAGSIFSANGVGEQLPGGGTRAQGLAGGGIGLADSLGINTMNPALAAYIPRTTFRVGGQIGFWTTLAEDRTDADGEFTWQDVAIYVPVTSRWKLGFGAQPLRQMDVLTIDEDTASFATTGNNVPFEARSRWRGSAIELRLDNSVRVTDKLALGLSAAYTLMRVERLQTLDFPQLSGRQYYYDSEYRQVETFRGWSATLGGHYQVSPKLGVGVTLKPRVSGNWTYDFTRSNADSTLKRDRRGKSPGDYRLGLSYRLGGRLVGVVDAMVGQWQGEELGILLADSLHSDPPQNPLFVSLGLEREAGRPPLYTGWGLWSWRGGLFYRQHYWPKRLGAAVADLGVAAGFSLPVAGGDGRLHVAAEGGQRGFDEAKLGAKEYFVRASLQLEITESWFQRAKPRIPQ